jgi:uncharacterized protein YqfB (UPF0267 family)
VSYQNQANHSIGAVIGYDTATGNITWNSGTLGVLRDAIALGVGRFIGHLYIGSHDGQVIDTDIATNTSITLASGGSPINTITIDPNNGSLLVTQLDRIVRSSFPPGPATTFQIDAPPASIVAGQPFSLTVTALDAGGYQAPGYTGTVSFSSSDTYPGLLPPEYTFTPSDNGTHNFGTVLYTAGAQTLTVQDTANPSITGSTTVTVDPAPASHLSLTAPPTAIAGSAFDVTVTALDPYGNIASDYTGTVAFTTTDPASGYVLPSDYTFTSTDAGVHRFSGGVTLLTAGSQTITVTDTANASFTASVPVQVTAAQASQFVLTLPSTTVAGTLFDIVLTALDPYNNVATSYTGTVTITSTDTSPGYLLPPDYTFTNADAGVHTFSGQAALIKAGSQTITATDTANAAITGSQTVTVTPAAASSLKIDAPTTAVPGVPFDVTVTAFDPYGNMATNYQGTVMFNTTDTDPGKILPPNYTFQATDDGTHTFAAGVTLLTPGLQTLTVQDTSTSTIFGSTGVLVSAPPTPPPGGGASGPSSPSTGIGMQPAGSVLSRPGIALVDRLFASLRQQDSAVIGTHRKEARQIDGNRWLLDLFPQQGPRPE